MALAQDGVYFTDTTEHHVVLKWGLGFESSSSNQDINPTGHQTNNKYQQYHKEESGFWKE